MLCYCHIPYDSCIFFLKKIMLPRRFSALKILNIWYDPGVWSRWDGWSGKQEGRGMPTSQKGPLKWISMFVWRIFSNGGLKKKEKKENNVAPSLSACSKVTVHSIMINCVNGNQHGVGLSALCVWDTKWQERKLSWAQPRLDSIIQITSAKGGGQVGHGNQWPLCLTVSHLNE